MIDLALNHMPPPPIRRDWRIGAIGSGFIMRDVHLVAYKKLGLDVAAITGQPVEQAREVASARGIARVYESSAELMADPAIEVLDIAVPPHVQPQIIAEAVRDAGLIRGILAQKPLAMNYPDAVATVEACEKGRRSRTRDRAPWAAGTRVRRNGAGRRSLLRLEPAPPQRSESLPTSPLVDDLLLQRGAQRSLQRGPSPALHTARQSRRRHDPGSRRQAFLRRCVRCRLAGSRQGHQRLQPPVGGAGFRTSIRAKLGLIFSEVKLQRQLNLAHGGRCRGNLTESRYRRRTRTAPPAYAGWTGQFHMVGSVEHLHAELKVSFFGDLEKLGDRNIYVSAPRSPQGVAAAVAKRARYRIGECRRVPPAVLVGIGQYRIDAGSAVQPGGVGNEIGAPGIPCGRVDHAAALQRGDGAQLPVAHHLVYDPSMVEKFLAFTERQRVEDGSD